MRKILSKHKAFFAFGIPALSAALLAGCNLYSFIDKPKGDEQILSAARACFDRADYACAREYYAQLSASYADIKASEEAFMILAENGAGMAAFMETFGSGGSGEALTSLAERMAPGSETKRLAIQEAYEKFDYTAPGADSDTLKQFVRYVTATALAAELLSENISNGEQLLKTRIVSSASCSTATACPVGSVNCNAGDGSVLIPGNTVSLTGDMSAVDIGHFRKAMSEIYDALNNLAASGGFNTGSQALAEALNDSIDLSDVGLAQCFRATMIENGIGR